MRPPEFWYSASGGRDWKARLLSPFGAIYGAVTAARLRRKDGYKAAIPVICAGNINVGGTGKTPTVIALVQRLDRHKVHVVSRGYGGQITKPTRVDERVHSAGDVGDEPLLISAFAPVWVARNRAEGLRAAEAAGAEVIVMDDGFQNPSVIKDLSLVIVDATRGFGNGRVLPAGPLREPVSVGLQRAGCLVSIGDQSAQAAFDEQWGDTANIARATAHLEPLHTGMDWDGLRVLAFAGIGDPARFFGTLHSLGADVIRAEPLDDHQTLTETLMKRLEVESTALSAQLVTTEKDAVRLPDSFRQKVLTLPVRLVFDEVDPLDDALKALGLTPS